MSASTPTLRWRGSASADAVSATLVSGGYRSSMNRSSQRARQLEERERVAMALRDDLVADRGVHRPVDVAERHRARIAFAEPGDRRSGSPARTCSLTPVRATQTTAIRSAKRRRATKPRVCTEASSSHCESSMTQISGCCSAASAHSVRNASATRKRSGGGPAVKPNNRFQRRPLRTGQTLKVMEHRSAQLVKAAQRELHLGFDTRGTRDAAARPSLQEIVD